MARSAAPGASRNQARARITADVRRVAVQLGRKPTKNEYLSRGIFQGTEVLEATGASTWPEALRLSGCDLALGSAPSNKLHAKRTAAQDGRVFHSKLEADRYSFLLLRERAKEISDLRTQVPFPISISESLVCIYVADFVYTDSASDERVVEDTKGHFTELAKLKIKLLKAVCGIEVAPVRRPDSIERRAAL